MSYHQLFRPLNTKYEKLHAEERINEIERRLSDLEAQKLKDFKAGDVVILKSGSPKMTIDTLSEDEAICVWFIDGDAKMYSASFSKILMEHYVPLDIPYYGCSYA